MERERGRLRHGFPMAFPASDKTFRQRYSPLLHRTQRMQNIAYALGASEMIIIGTARQEGTHLCLSFTNAVAYE